MPPPRPIAVVLCASDPRNDPRPHRMIGWLREHFDVRVISHGGTPLPSTTAVKLPRPADNSVPRKARNAIELKLRRYESRLWPPAWRELAAAERAHHPAFVVVHDLTLLPLALAIRGDHGRIFFDAREYYPRHFEDRWFWRFLLQDFNRYLCRSYLARADIVVTVSRGLADAYRSEFGIECGVLPSFADPAALMPGQVDPRCIRMVHHGFASRPRRLELMLEVLRRTDERFHLDLILVGADRRYQASLRAQAAGHPRITFREPLPFAELVRETNTYDIGLFLVPPSNFNLLHGLGNKFFEFIQARLMIAIGPSLEMVPYVRKHALGVIADDFEPQSLALRLNALSAGDIMQFKQHAHRAAAVLNSSVLREKFLRVALDGAGAEAFS